MAKKTFLLRLPEDLHEWLSKQPSIHQFILDAVREKKVKEENKQLYSEAWRDGFNEGYAKGKNEKKD